MRVHKKVLLGFWSVLAAVPSNGYPAAENILIRTLFRRHIYSLYLLFQIALKMQKDSEVRKDRCRNGRLQVAHPDGSAAAKEEVKLFWRRVFSLGSAGKFNDSSVCPTTKIF